MTPIIATARIATNGLTGAFVVGTGVVTGDSAAFIWSAWPAPICSVLEYGLYPARVIVTVEDPG